MPTTTRTVGRFHRTLWIVALLAFALGVFGILRFGTFFVQEDPLQSADAVFVLAGSQMNRPLEAAEIYRAGLVPRIVISADADDAATFLETKGIHVASGAEVAREALLQFGVPGSAFVMPARIHDNTAAEASTLRDLAQSRGWTRVIVVTSKYHTRRAGFAMRRALRGTGVTVFMRATRYDRSEPARWWRRRSDVRMLLEEAPKLAAYLLGLGE